MLWFPSTRYTWRTQTLICPDTPQKTCQEHNTLWHVTFPDTSRSDPGFAECRGISRSRKFHEIAHFTRCEALDSLALIYRLSNRPFHCFWRHLTWETNCQQLGKNDSTYRGKMKNLMFIPVSNNSRRRLLFNIPCEENIHNLKQAILYTLPVK